MKHYKGFLGDFVFDPAMFELRDGFLKYVGGTHYGCIKCKIPEGIEICDHMFEGNTRLKVGPVLPKSCISANSMFADCINLTVFPDINLSLMESDDFDCSTVFSGCSCLETMCITKRNERRDTWVCACEHSVDYGLHLQNMQKIIATENDRRGKMFSVQHPFKSYYNKKAGQKDEVECIRISTDIPYIDFDGFKELVHIIDERKRGNILGIAPDKIKSVTKITSDENDCPIDNPNSVVHSTSDDPSKMRV